MEILEVYLTVLPLEGHQTPGDFRVRLNLSSPSLNDLAEQLVSRIPMEDIKKE